MKSFSRSYFVQFLSWFCTWLVDFYLMCRDVVFEPCC